MDSQKFVEWLKNENLYDICAANYKHFEKVFKDSLAVQNEEVLMVGDTGYPARRVPAIMLGCYVLAAKRLGLNFKLQLQGPKQRGDFADEGVIESMLSLQNGSVIVMSLSDKLGSMDYVGQSYRKFMAKHEHRFVSSPSLGLLKTSKFPQ